MTEDRTIVPNARQLRALTHPVRLRMLGMLRIDGPATATSLAERLGLNTGATSYHLRQLAEHGFIEDDAAQGSGRERWWKATYTSTRTELGSRDDSDDPDVDRRLPADGGHRVHPAAPAGDRGATAAARRSGATPPRSATGPTASRPPRRRVLIDRIDELLTGIEDDDDPEAAAVTFNINVFPRPGALGEDRVVRRPLYGWLAAELVTLMGTRVSMVALPLLVLLSTGSAVDTGLVALAETLPLVLMKVLAGPVIDRIGARRVSVTCNLASVPVVGAIPLLYDTGHLGAARPARCSWPIAGALRGPADAGTYALLPTLVAEAGVPMERATGLHSVAERTASMGGAALAGVLVVALGPANALLIDAASFGVAALVLLWATAGLPEAEQPVEEDDATGLPYLQRLREGWRFLRGDPVLLGITVMVSITNLLDAAWTAVLMPVWAVESGGGAGALGLLYAVFSGAAVAGALCAATFAERLPRYWIYLVGFMVAGIPRFVAVALDAPLVVLVAVFVAGGFAAGFLNPILGAVMFERIPPNLTGRVTALSVASSWSLIPFGGLLGGVLVDTSGLTVALVLVGIAYFAATTLPALDPRWREIDRRPDQPAGGMAPSTASTGTSTGTVSG